ncbi:hypothetical protein BG61_09330 [Caballeronia glathei]|uniref:Uncharacterized protein n=1 Tax=Caballeronia glathei TaxID=60547 RepID=A0A069PAK9_9BURK|nr:hypothetical protein BG61_09330 [Caballeronia glathei]
MTGRVFHGHRPVFIQDLGCDGQFKPGAFIDNEQCARASVIGRWDRSLGNGYGRGSCRTEVAIGGADHALMFAVGHVLSVVGRVQF